MIILNKLTKTIFKKEYSHIFQYRLLGVSLWVILLFIHSCLLNYPYKLNILGPGIICKCKT